MQFEAHEPQKVLCGHQVLCRVIHQACAKALNLSSSDEFSFRIVNSKEGWVDQFLDVNLIVTDEMANACTEVSPLKVVLVALPSRTLWPLSVRACVWYRAVC